MGNGRRGEVKRPCSTSDLAAVRLFDRAPGGALAVVAPLIDLGARLAGDEWPAAEGAHRVAGGGALDAVPLPGLRPQHEDGNAGQEAAEEAAQEAGLAQVVSVPLDEEAWDARTAQAWKKWNEGVFRGAIASARQRATYRFRSRRGSHRFHVSIPQTCRI